MPVHFTATALTRAPLPPRKRAQALVCLSMWFVLLTGCDPFHTGFDDVEDAQVYTAATLTPVADDSPTTLNVMNWNAKYGAGRIDFFFDCHGDRSLMNAQEVEANLDALAAKINQVDPDVLLLQEIDVNSKRAAYIDQVQYLLDKTDLNHAVYASQWRADYVPSDGVGPVDSGNAIFSKYPLKNATRVAMPPIASQDAITRYFYLKRNMLIADVDVGRDDVVVVNVHTAAYSTDGTKREQIDLFKAKLDELSGQGKVVLGGGDLNALPPGSEQLQGFDDFVCEDGGDFDADDYSPEVGWLDELYASYTPAVSLEDYQADNAAYFTHTTDKDLFWNRKLDYLFTNTSFVAGSTVTHQDESKGGMATMPLSDHAPISATWELP